MTKTPDQARDFAQSLWDAGAADDEVNMIRGLADQVEALIVANKDLINWYEALKADYDKQAQQVAVPTGCHRSHPHEEMNEVCKLKTEIARLKAAARQEPSTAMMYKISAARSVYRDYKDVQCAFDYLEALIAADPPDSTPTDWSAA